MPDRNTALIATVTDLRSRALEARAERDRIASEAVELSRREHLAWALDDLHRALAQFLGVDLDDVAVTVEWANDMPIAFIQGVRFRIEEGYDYGPYHHVRAAVAREGCGHEVGGTIGLHGTEAAWSDLGDLILRAEESFQHPCRQCVEEAAVEAEGGERATLPTLAERLERLVRDIVREEVAG